MEPLPDSARLDGDGESGSGGGRVSTSGKPAAGRGRGAGSQRRGSAGRTASGGSYSRRRRRRRRRRRLEEQRRASGGEGIGRGEAASYRGPISVTERDRRCPPPVSRPSHIQWPRPSRIYLPYFFLLSRDLCEGIL